MDTELAAHSLDAGHDEAAAVLAKTIPWDALLTSNVLTDRDVQMIRRFDKRDKFTQAALWEKEGAAYAAVFVNVLRSVSKDETAQYVLALLEEALAADKERVRLFQGPHMGTAAAAPFPVVLRLLERADWFIQVRAAHLLCKLLAASPERGRVVASAPGGGRPPPGSLGETCLSFLDWAVRTLRASSGDARVHSAAVTALACLMAERSLRPAAHAHGALGLLAAPLRAAGEGPHNVQLLYEAAAAVWLLSFYPPAAEGCLASGALAGLLEAARSASKEKVVRVALAALVNLLECDAAPGARAAAAAEAGRLACALRLRAFHDEEVLAALSALESHAVASAQAAGSFERYRQSVLSGALDGSAGRGGEAFWREHSAAFEADNYALIRRLCVLLGDPATPPAARAVACHDVGCVAAVVPRGRTVVTECGGKTACMALMTSEDEEVRKQALLATQKIMLQGWQYAATA